MAKKSNARARTVRSQPSSSQQVLAQRRWRRKLVLGGVILALALGVGVGVRFVQQRALSPRLQGVVDRHYTRGTAGAPVVMKEFSDYT
jgi:hypothetical protein